MGTWRSRTQIIYVVSRYHSVHITGVYFVSLLPDNLHVPVALCIHILVVVIPRVHIPKIRDHEVPGSIREPPYTK